MASSSAPGYYDFDSFEEIQITTGGGDASQEAGGVAVNFVTKSGSNQLKGSARYYDANQRFESANAPAEVIAQGGGAGNPIKDVAEYGFEVGGPIKKDKAWFWGAANRNDSRRHHRLPEGGRARRLVEHRRSRNRSVSAEQSEPEVELPVGCRAPVDVPVQPRRQDPRIARGEPDDPASCDDAIRGSCRRG